MMSCKAPAKKGKGKGKKPKGNNTISKMLNGALQIFNCLLKADREC
jgi:hypothetical protein